MVVYRCNLRDFFVCLFLLTVGLFLGALMLKHYELSEVLERLQSSGCYDTSSWAHTFGVAQDQKQPCLPNS